MTQNQLATKAWVMFTFNFPMPQKFINYVCEQTNRPDLYEHFLAKWREYYDRYGCDAVMNRFYAELSSEYRNALADYACKVYAPEGLCLSEEEKRLLNG